MLEHVTLKIKIYVKKTDIGEMVSFKNVIKMARTG